MGLVTRDGHSVNIISTNAKIDGGNYDTVALIRTKPGNDFIEWYSSNNVRGDYLCVSERIDHERDIYIKPLLSKKIFPKEALASQTVTEIHPLFRY